MKKTYLLLLTLAVIFSSCKSSKHPDLGEGLFADIKTNKGNIVLKLEHEKTPVTVANFVSLAEGDSPFVSEEFKNKPYYEGLTFHRVMKDFMIQGGDPTASGSGGPGYKFFDEFNDSLVHDKKGILSMANPGPDSNGSQFFITHKPTPWLDNRHSVFGEVVAGMDVVDSIANVQVASGNKPMDDVVMNAVEIIRNGKAAKKFDAVAVMTEYFAGEEERIAAAKKEAEEKAALAIQSQKDLASVIPADKAKAQALQSGLKILNLKKGSGEKPRIGQKVGVIYAGYLEDGSMFDSNDKEVVTKYNKYNWNREQANGYKPTPMTYSTEARLIAGFKEALLTMSIGDKIRVFIPAHLGYGEQGSGPIPPNSELVFDLEITGIAN